ncbi:tetratricopeptide repeat protein [bacterium]|nr:tetratricopeptide repeat protein [bacterium]MBU1073363.1 tetratricopeptide repeat protein [bacterium]MBU1675782.1 tetratricopeptide repeat protein [bacterium]
MSYAEEIARDLQELPHGVATSYMIGLTLMEQGDTAGAVPYLAHAHRLSPEVEEFATAYRDALIQLGYLRDALEVSQLLVARQSVQYETWLQHVSLLVAMERYDQALGALEAFRLQHPDSLQLGILQAEILSRSRRWDDALSAYRSLLPVLPEEREHIYMAMAEMAVHLQRHAEATAIWAEGLTALPESRPLRLGALQHHIALGRDAAAITVAMTGDSLSAVGSEVLDTSWVRTAAGLIVGEGRDAVAAGFLQPLFDTEALDLETSLFMGRLLARRGNWPAAVAALESTVRRWPESPLPQLFLGEFMAEAGDLNGGEQHVRRAIEMDPMAPDFLLSLISILSKLHPDAFAHGGRLPVDDPLRREVLALAGKAQELLAGDDTPSSHMMIGATYQAMGEHEGAVSSYLIAATEPKFRREALMNLSLAYDKTGRHDDAREVLESLLTEHDGDPVVLNALGYTLADQGVQLDRAERLIRAALKQDPDNPAYLDSLGWLYYRLGAYADAIDYLVNAANTLPEDPEILEHLGMVLLELGRHERALEILERALLLGGDAASLQPVIEELKPVKQ